MFPITVISVIVGCVAGASAQLSSTSNITISQPNVPFLPSKFLPKANGARHSEAIVDAFTKLGRSTVWTVERLAIEGDTYEPEGMVRVGEDRIFVSGTEAIVRPVSYGNHTIINGTDRDNGWGFSHITLFDGAGKRIADATYNVPYAAEYHFGGVDYDGENLWVTLAQYRPNTTASVLKIDPATLEATQVLHYNDHLGGAVYDPKKKLLSTLNWGSRNASIFDLNKTQTKKRDQKAKAVVKNPSFFDDVQDCALLGETKHYPGRSLMLCSGVATITGSYTYNQGGIHLVDLETMQPYYEIPFPYVSDLNTSMTQNPFDVDFTNGTINLYFMPDQHNSTVYKYTPVINSPYEY